MAGWASGGRASGGGPPLRPGQHPRGSFAGPGRAGPAPQPPAGFVSASQLLREEQSQAGRPARLGQGSGRAWRPPARLQQDPAAAEEEEQQLQEALRASLAEQEPKSNQRPQPSLAQGPQQQWVQQAQQRPLQAQHVQQAQPEVIDLAGLEEEPQQAQQEVIDLAGLEDEYPAPEPLLQAALRQPLEEERQRRQRQVLRRGRGGAQGAGCGGGEVVDLTGED